MAMHLNAKLLLPGFWKSHYLSIKWLRYFPFLW
jgi:hypothetical protein